MTTTNDNSMITAQPLAPSRRSSRRVLAVRAMVGATSWLDGRLRWRDGRVAWEIGGALIVPVATDLSLAQRYHNKIRRYPIAAHLALGDSQAFLEQALAQQPGRADLAARSASLRARLADQERMLAAARERMAQVAAEALFAAAEQQGLECYRRRLAAVAGPLPTDLHLDDDR